MRDATFESRRVTSLQGALIVAKRELGAYFDSPIAYVTASAFLALAGAIFMNNFFLRGVVDMGEFFRYLPVLIALFLPALTMRSWSEELSRGTFEILMALPLRPISIVLGKYLAALAFYVLMLVGSSPIVIMLLSLGKPAMGLIAASYLGGVCLGGFFLALGCFLSALTREQIVAYVLTAFLGAIFVLTGLPAVVDVLDGLSPAWQIGTILHDSFSVMPHYETLCRGIVGIGDLFYFSLMITFFLVMNEITLSLSRY